MRVLILGGDGYLGWPTAMYLSRRGHEVAVVDNYFRRHAGIVLSCEPLIPVPEMHQRTQVWKSVSGKDIAYYIDDVCHYAFLARIFREFKPNTVIHYAEQPSAPYSMMDRNAAIFTLTNNLVSTANLVHAVQEFAPRCHIIKLGTMGVYGTPNIDIEEGYLEVEYKGRSHRFLYPKEPGSLDHLSKVMDGDLLYFFCRMRSIRVTDMNQGIVYCLRTEESAQDDLLLPMFSYDAIFGTVLNRFLVQAVAGIPLTVYGIGGQTRGFINIKDVLACVELAILNPASSGEYRVFNQIAEIFTVNQLAKTVQQAGARLGLTVEIQHIPNPRREAEEHYYNPDYTGLLSLGLKPHYLTEDILAEMLSIIIKYRDKINPDLIMPGIFWKQPMVIKLVDDDEPTLSPPQYCSSNF
jgi:UDP-sulfoquinovose synthase